MQFTTVIVALFAAIAMAAPAAEPAAADLAAAAAYCTKCSGGSKSCCSLTTCNIYPC
jgi:hypothetical protein